MSGRGLLAMFLGTMATVSVLAPGAAWAATGASGGIIGSETIVVVPAGQWVNTLVEITWARRPPGGREFVALPQGFSVAQAIRPRVAVTPTSDGVWVKGRPESVSLNVVSRATAPYLLEETAAAPVKSATLLVAAGAYPSGNALAPFVYEGRVRLGGRWLLAFSAADVAQGTVVFIPIALSDPVPAERAAVASALAVLAGASALGAAFWTLGRFGGLRGRDPA